MKRNIINKTVLCSKTLVIFFMCITFLFVSCGKDKTIEKIIYGENSNNEDNKYSLILDKEQFNSVAITREFNNIDDFFNYIEQCWTNKTNLAGLKFKIRGSFTVTNSDLLYSDDYSYYGGHYFYKKLVVSLTTPYRTLTINFTDTDLNSTITNTEDVVFIVIYSNYSYDSEYQKYSIYSYSYL